MKDKIKVIPITIGMLVLAIIAWFAYMNGSAQGNYFIMNPDGNIVLDHGYEDCLGWFEADDTTFWLLVDHNRFDSDSCFYRETMYVINDEGKTVLKDSIGEYDDLIAGVSCLNNLLWFDGRYTIIDSKGEITHQFPEGVMIMDGTSNFGVYPFYYGEGVNALSRPQQLYGFINAQDEIIVEPKFKEVWGFTEEGLALVVTQDGKYGFIDIEGNFVIEPVYDFAHSFSDGIAVVCNDDKYAYIDKNGNLISEYVKEDPTYKSESSNQNNSDIKDNEKPDIDSQYIFLYGYVKDGISIVEKR